MTFLKSLWADLIEKRLWPIAVVLLVALVAVPVFLGSGGEEPFDVASLGATGATGGLGAQAQVSLDQPGATRLDREGKLRDPFRQRAVPDTGTTGTTGTTGPRQPDEPVTPTTPTTTDPPLPPQPPQPPSKQKEKPLVPALSDYVTEIRFGRPGDTRPRRTVARLTPLPTVAQPFFVYLGVLTDRRTAVFLLSSDVEASGQAKCKPDKDICETIELRAGQTAKLAVTNDDDSVTRYTLTVVDVRRRGTASGSGTTTTAGAPAKSATKAASKSSNDSDLGTDRYSYDDETGLLRRVRTSKSAKVGAHLPGAKGASVVDLSKVGSARVRPLPEAGLWEMPAFSPR